MHMLVEVCKVLFIFCRCYACVAPNCMLPALKIMGMASVKEGEMIRVICNLTGGDVSQHSITWLIDGALFDPARSSNIEVRDFPMAEKGFFLSEMYVRKSTVANSGTYSCRGPGQLQANFSVEVVAAGVCFR